MLTAVGADRFANGVWPAPECPAPGCQAVGWRQVAASQTMRRM